MKKISFYTFYLFYLRNHLLLDFRIMIFRTVVYKVKHIKKKVNILFSYISVDKIIFLYYLSHLLHFLRFSTSV